MLYKRLIHIYHDIFSCPQAVLVNAFQKTKQLNTIKLYIYIYHCSKGNFIKQVCMATCPAMPALFWRDYNEVVVWGFFVLQKPTYHVHFCFLVGLVNNFSEWILLQSVLYIFLVVLDSRTGAGGDNNVPPICHF